MTEIVKTAIIDIMRTIYLAGLEPLILTFFLVIALIIISAIIFFNRRRALIRNLLEEVALANSLQFKVSSNKRYDYELQSNDNKFLIKLVYIPANSTVTINSKNTWCLRYGGSSRKGYSKTRYLNELIPFLEYKVPSLNERKIIMIYPHTNKVQKYLNESEIAILKHGELAYDYRVTSYQEFASGFQDLQ
ncbi:MAG: hypothetical protein PHX62_04180 [Bacilli bacterium]|nr:hypothetical protein [Bacilli bacterium]